MLRMTPAPEKLANRPFVSRFGVPLLLAVALSASVQVRAATPGEAQVGQVLPEARLRGLNGAPRMLSAFRGKPLIINVWASWCGPCRQEMASLERLAWRDAGVHFTVIGISTDDEADRARAWLSKSNATINQYIDNELEMEKMLGASRLPLTVLVDADGRIADKVYGAREWDSSDSLTRIGKAFRILGYGRSP